VSLQFSNSFETRDFHAFGVKITHPLQEQLTETPEKRAGTFHAIEGDLEPILGRIKLRMSMNAIIRRTVFAAPWCLLQPMPQRKPALFSKRSPEEPRTAAFQMQVWRFRRCALRNNYIRWHLQLWYGFSKSIPTPLICGIFRVAG
jgi:hypothetical protein